MFICTFCRQERSLVAKGPGVCICEFCLNEIAMNDVRRDPEPCSFCHKSEGRSWFPFRYRRIAGVGSTGDVRICSGCVPIARGALAHNRMRAAADSRSNREGS